MRGYRKHIIWDLLKDKADVFYQRMQERRVLEGGSSAAASEVSDILQKKNNASDVATNKIMQEDSEDLDDDPMPQKADADE